MIPGDPRAIARAAVRFVAGAEPAALGRVFRDPRLARRRLLRARAAPATFALLAAFVVFALPPLLDRVLPAIYPDVPVRTKFLGVLPRTEHVPDPRIPLRRHQWIVLAWVATGCATLLLVVRRLADPRAGAPNPMSVDTIVDLPGPTGPAPRAGSPAPPVSADASAERRYEIRQEIARGGMGVVYAATDRVLKRDVALKSVSVSGVPDADRVLRFRREAEALATLTHPNIVQVYDLVEDAERLWMVMELVDGEDLGTILSRRGALPPEEVARIGSQVAQGLAFAHERGIVHRDVKPSNVLVARDGTPKIADFGVARMMDAGTATLPGQVIGSPHYLSPEQASGRDAEARSDVYSLGVMLFEMLAGRRPFEGDLMSLLSQHLTQPPPELLRAGDPGTGELGAVVHRMLEKDPARRPSMEDTRRLLRPFCGAALEA